MPAKPALRLAALLLAFSAGAAPAQLPPAGHIADAKPGELRVLCMNGLKTALEGGRAEIERRLGKHVVAQYGSSRGDLYDTALAGQDFEVAILLPETNAELISKGKLAPGTYNIAAVPVALGLRGPAPAGLDVTSEAGLKQALLGARSVLYRPYGAAIDTVKAIFSRLDLAGKIHDSSAIPDPIPLAPGEYEIQIFPFTEIAASKGVRNLGPVIAPMQVPAPIQAAIGAHAADPKAALAFIRLLQGPIIDPGLAANAMVRVQ